MSTERSGRGTPYAPGGIYYEDQAGWSSSDYYALWRYFDRLAEYVGPTRAQVKRPEHRSART